jgi:hypothetical protein
MGRPGSLLCFALITESVGRPGSLLYSACNKELVEYQDPCSIKINQAYDLDDVLISKTIVQLMVVIDYHYYICVVATTVHLYVLPAWIV